MEIKKDDIVLTGKDPDSGLSFYYSTYFGQNIVRKLSSLTGERVKRDPAFKGFRQSGNRMKQASPIAASLYKMVTPELKQYGLYRLLTGEALKMLKEGLDPTQIAENLKREHIDPLLNMPKRRSRLRGRLGLDEDSRISFKADHRIFPSFIKLNGNKKRILGYRDDPRLSKGDNYLQNQEMQERYSRKTQLIKKTPETKGQKLIYVGRLQECKKFKMWIRSF